MTNKQKIGFGYAGGTVTVIVPEGGAEIIKALSKPNGKPISDRSVIEKVMGANTDRYFKCLMGGNNVFNSCRYTLGWPTA